MALPITDYTAFFGAAKQAVQELDELKQKEKLLQDLEKQLDEKKKAADMWYNCYCDEQAKVRTLTSDMALVRDVVNRLSK